MIVHFPIALVLAGFLSDIIGLATKKVFFRQAALYLLLLGTAGTVGAYLSGDAAGEGMEEGSLGKALELHEQAALITLWVTLAAALFRLGAEFLKNNNRVVKIVAMLLFAMSTVAVSRTGYLGGQLVYRHAAGVELGIPDFQIAPADESAEKAGD